MVTLMNSVRSIIENYVPLNEQELQDKRQMLAFMDTNEGWLNRDNAMAHMTASAWVVDPARKWVLMIYHNIYGSWSWTGGHADGEDDMLAVAVREVEEETGVTARPVSKDPVSIESLCVAAHIKRGMYVSSHIHMNVTYLLEADPNAPARIKPDENSGVMWVPFEEVNARVTEDEMRPIYAKLIERARRM